MLKDYEEQIADIDSKLSQMSKIVIGFIVIPDVDTKWMVQRSQEMIGGNPRYEVAVGTKDEIVIGSATVRFAASTH
jgi:hypothetical protein